MYIVAVKIKVLPDFVDSFVAETRKNHVATRQEPGNLRFDVLQREDDPTGFMLYEVYRTKDDFTAHQKTPHYLAWKETVAPWMAVPREGVRHKNVYPSDDEGW
jgi:autoinducer 2-degrading protein